MRYTHKCQSVFDNSEYFKSIGDEDTYKTPCMLDSLVKYLYLRKYFDLGPM